MPNFYAEVISMPTLRPHCTQSKGTTVQQVLAVMHARPQAHNLKKPRRALVKLHLFSPTLFGLL